MICSPSRRAVCQSTSVRSFHPPASFPVIQPRQSLRQADHRLRLVRGASSSSSWSSSCAGIESGTTVGLLDLALATVQVACASIISIAHSLTAQKKHQ
jgi:hypothetical protein